MSTGTESSQSVSFTGYYKGFSVLVTKRDVDAAVKPLIDDAMKAIDYMLEMGFKPSWNDETNGKVLGTVKAVTASVKRENVTSINPNSKPCELHPGQNLYYKEGKFGGFWSHKVGDDANGKAIYCNGYDKSKKMTVDEYERVQSEPDF